MADTSDNIDPDLQTSFVDETTSKNYIDHRPSYSDKMFRIMSDYCRETLPDMNLAVDSGCGPGNSTLGFTKYFKKVLGFDISESQIAMAPTDIPNCEFKVASATDLSFLPDASVDLYAFGLAFNLMPREQVLAEADRVLKPGGTLAIFCYSPPSSSDKNLNDFLTWAYGNARPLVDENVLESWNRYPDLSLPYPGWIRHDGDDIALSHEMSPEGVLSLHQMNCRFIRQKGHDVTKLLSEGKERMDRAVEEIKKYADPKVLHLSFPTVIMMGRKPQ